MKIKSLIGTLVCMTIILASSCKRDNDSAPHITVSPSPLYIYGNIGDLVTFNITVDSEVRLSKFYISQQPDNQVPVTVLDTIITSKGVVFAYYYRMPASLAGKSVIFEFKAEDENGNVGKQVRRVFVANPAAVTLTETTGHRMYSNLSASNPDAYNLETNAGQFSTSDSTLRDMQDASGTDTTLSRNFISPAGGQFVSNDGYDYANATDVSMINAYNGGVKLTQLSGVGVGDIIITKLGSLTTNKYVIIRISDIVDLPGKDNDYYEFTIKK
jgi:hypothetical protein